MESTILELINTCNTVDEYADKLKNQARKMRSAICAVCDFGNCSNCEACMKFSRFKLKTK